MSVMLTMTVCGRFLQAAPLLRCIFFVDTMAVTADQLKEKLTQALSAQQVVGVRLHMAAAFHSFMSIMPALLCM